MFDHLFIRVKDTNTSKTFYEAVLTQLGYKLLYTFSTGETTVYAFGYRFPAFWLAPITKDHAVSGPAHIAFSAKTRAEVDAFYEAGIKAGGKDNGKPGLRSNVHKFYYAAFLYDPDGNNIECVSHYPPYVGYLTTWPVIAGSLGTFLGMSGANCRSFCCRWSGKVFQFVLIILG